MSPDLAPPSSDADASPIPETIPPSQRLTFDVAAVASLAGLHDSRGNVPLDFCVPVATGKVASPVISHDEILVYLYVDGAMSLRQIAAETGLPLKQTITIMLGLLQQGLIAIR
jgi:hypothetical protein